MLLISIQLVKLSSWLLLLALLVMSEPIGPHGKGMKGRNLMEAQVRGRQSIKSSTSKLSILRAQHSLPAPSVAPSITASSDPTSLPSRDPTPLPSVEPTPRPSPSQPTPNPTPTPTAPTEISDGDEVGPVLFEPGNFSQSHRSSDQLIKLSNGLAARPIATAGQYVEYRNGGRSSIEFHIDPDGAAVFPKADGGWYYVSNAEEPSVGTNWNNGGVGSIEFDQDGEIIRYRRIANRLRNNCGGGKTPWNSWITCEEITNGKVWQTDPAGKKAREGTNMGNFGMYESFAYDDGTEIPTFYVTQDTSDGVLTRFTPNDEGMACYNQVDDYDRWCTLEHGRLDYLSISGGANGNFVWTTNLTSAKTNAEEFYPNSEGIDVADGVLYFTSKVKKRLVILDLRQQTYTYHTTRSGAFNQQPDQVARLVNDDESILYFCEDGGNNPGVHGRLHNGRYFTILYGQLPQKDETTGLAFSPLGDRMYVSFQDIGVIYEVTRTDHRPFQGELLDIKYHAS